MRLADLIEAGSRSPSNAFRQDFQTLACAIRQAQRFDISPEVCSMASAVQGSGLKHLQQARVHGRVPFQDFWCEWKGASAVYAGRSDLAPGTRVVDRCGVLIGTDETHLRGVMMMAWSAFDDAGQETVNMSPLDLRFDWTDGAPPVQCIFRHMQALSVLRVGSGSRGTAPLSHALGTRIEEIDSKEEMRWGFGNCSLFPQLQQRLDELFHQHRYSDPGVGQKMLDAVLNDWAGEPAFVQALIIVLNSRNMVDIGPREDKAKLNVDRQKRGKPTFHEFSTVNINLSQAARRMAAAAQGEGFDMRAHLVRGHFKVRKTGVYWWAPFTRGNPQHGVVERQGYEVRA